MKKIMLSLTACLLCLLMTVSVCLDEEHNILDEWYVIPLTEDNSDFVSMSSGEMVLQKSSYGVHELYDEETSKRTGVMLDHEGVPVYAGDFYCSENRCFVVLMLSVEPDGKTYVLYSGDTDAAGNRVQPAAAPWYFAPAETMLITPTHMLFNGSRIEYYLFGDRLFTIDGNGYVKAPLEWMNEDVFIARPKDGSDALLFVRTKN